jgi:surface carbohydrate biosynthesis protein
MNIYIKMEVARRDLDSRLLLGLVAAERGHNVYLGPSGLTTRLAVEGYLSPGIVHEKSITPGTHRLEELQSYCDKGFICTSQDEESGLLEDDYSIFAGLRFSKESIGLVEKIFSWGGYDRLSLLEKYPDIECIEEKIVATGSPRVDMWRPELDGFYPKPSGKVGSKDYILFASNFGAIAGYDPFWSDVKIARETGYVDRGYDIQAEIGRNAYKMQLMGRFVAAITRLATEQPELNFIVRPHPAENPSAWEAFIGRQPNIYVVNTGPISRWVRHAKMIIHNGCTTALESVVSRKTVIAYRPLVSKHELSFPNEVSCQIFSEEALSNIVAEMLSNDRKWEPQDVGHSLDKVRQRLGSLDGKFAADKIVDEWEKLATNQLCKNNIPGKLQYLAWAYFWRRTLSRTAPVLLAGKKKARRVQQLYKFPPISQSEIKVLHHRFVTTLDRFSDVKVKVYGRHLIYLSNQKTVKV